jgi:hypothetical protein
MYGRLDVGIATPLRCERVCKSKRPASRLPSGNSHVGKLVMLLAIPIAFRVRSGLVTSMNGRYEPPSWNNCFCAVQKVHQAALYNLVPAVVSALAKATRSGASSPSASDSPSAIEKAVISADMVVST